MEKTFEMYIEDEILVVFSQKQFTMDLELATRLVAKRLELSKGNSYPILIDLKNTKYITIEARKYLSNEGAFGIRAGAFLTKSLSLRVIINCFLALYNVHNIPSKLFTEEDKAKIWLKQFCEN